MGKSIGAHDSYGWNDHLCKVVGALLVTVFLPEVPGRTACVFAFNFMAKSISIHRNGILMDIFGGHHHDTFCIHRRGNQHPSG